MTSDFLNTNIGTVCEVGDGAHAKVKRQKSGIPYLTSKNLGLGYLKLNEVDYISEEDYQKLFQKNSRVVRCPMPGDILIGIIGTFGNAYLYKDYDRFGISSSIGIIRPNKEIVHPYFLYYVVTSEEFRNTHGAYKSGSVQGYTNITTIKSLPIVIPPLPEQKAIARILGSLDDKIELNRRMNETLEAMARAIFKDWFVDFGPTRAKMEGRAPYLPEPIWSLFPDAIDPQSGLPIGWELGSLGCVSESVNRIVNPVEIDAQTPYIGLEHIPRRSISLSNWGSAGKVTSNKLKFETREFLFGKLRPYFHKVGIAPINGICSTDIVVIRAKSEIWSSFVLEVISSDDFVEYTNLTSTGTKMPRTSWNIMSKYELALPSDALVKHFDLTIQPCMNQIIDNIHQSRTLAELRDALLPKLMSGEIRVKDAERLVEEVL